MNALIAVFLMQNYYKEIFGLNAIEAQGCLCMASQIFICAAFLLNLSLQSPFFGLTILQRYSHQGLLTSCGTLVRATACVNKYTKVSMGLININVHPFFKLYSDENR